MNLKLITHSQLADALAFEPLLDRAATESAVALHGEATPAGTARRFLERDFERAQTLVLTAHEGAGTDPVALCVTGPLVEPLTAGVAPVVVLLYVAPELRHRGLARALVREAARLLAARGAGDLSVRASHNDDALISMGERWGFVRAWELMTRES